VIIKSKFLKEKEFNLISSKKLIKALFRIIFVFSHRMENGVQINAIKK